jgi:hypothetical protein
MSAEFVSPGAYEHPVLICADTIARALEDAAAVPVEFMQTSEKAAALVRLSRLADRLSALRLRLLAHADDVATDVGARDAAAWLAHETLADGGATRRDLALGESLDQRWTRLGGALADGRVNRAQAQVIAHALDELPATELPAEILVQAEEHLIELAAEFGPRELRVLGRKILDVIAPEIGEEQEAKQLADEERRARETSYLRTTRLGDGSTRITIKVPDAVAQRLTTYLDAFTSPRSADRLGQAAVAEADRIPFDRRRGLALSAFLDSIDPKRLPLHGGDATTVFVTVSLDQLRAELGTADVIGADVDRLSASEVRRLACMATIVPAVMGTKSEVLDLGRGSRLFDKAQRRALRLRDKRCRAEGCNVPAAWCEAHHRKSWSAGGSTDLDDGVLLCNFHHHRAHDDRYLHTDLPNGDVRFRRRR